MNSGWIYREHVPRTADGLTVLDYYTQRYQHSSRAEWQSRIQAGQVLLSGVTTTIATRLVSGQELAYHRPPWQEPAVPLTFAVLHEDPDVLVVAKPAGLPVLPGGGFLEHTLLWQLQQRYPQDTPIPIHRLGRGTSGLLLLARSPAVRAYLSQQMRGHHIRKTYRALVQGTAMRDHFTITQPIGKQPYPVLGYVYGAHPEGAFAQSECKVLRRRADTTVLEVSILTGRPHQIRIHLATAGYPLVGDPLYTIGGRPIAPPAQGKLPVPGDCGYHLHAERLTLTQRSGAPLTVVCPPPTELTES